MQYIKGENNKTAKVWVDNINTIEPGAVKQIKLMLEIPYLFKHIAIMPDCHVGKGAVIGSVVALENTVVPNIVGVDIGCGMSAYQTDIKFDMALMNKEFWNDFKTRVSRKIPVGFSSHKSPLKHLVIDIKAKDIVNVVEHDASRQVGTLGGGNHFLEVQNDQDNNLWLMVHSGSRHSGLTISNYYNQKARELNEKNSDNTPLNLNFLRLDQKEGHGYLNDMTWAINYALENRWIMLENLVVSFYEVLKRWIPDQVRDDGLSIRSRGINIHHNFANIENHFGKDVVVHRKGATQAYLNQIGIIPGSMGTPSFIVKGKGNIDAYKSCSHGAGRIMSRTKAKELIKEPEFSQSLKNTFTKASKNYIDEAPQAYKDINDVIAQQKELIEVTHKLTPILTIKG